MGFCLPRAAPGECKEPQDQQWTIGGQPLQAAAPFDCGHDLVVLDEHMPGSICGTAAMAVMREAGCGIVLVGLSGSSIAKEHLACGADLSWCKPLPLREKLAADLVVAFAARRR